MPHSRRAFGFVNEVQDETMALSWENLSLAHGANKGTWGVIHQYLRTGIKGISLNSLLGLLILSYEHGS
jgi:hypothetical protein